jgi:DNA ligase 1
MLIDKTLYKRDSKGKVREWYITIKKDTFTTHHGLKGGKTVEKTTHCKPKNVGRTNATTGSQQALAEATAKYKKQLDREGYSDDIDQLAYSSFTRPMLARDYSKLAHQVKWEHGVYASPKLDGVRAIWIQGKGFQSRKGTFYNVPHLEKLLKECNRKLDGELYIHDTPLNEIVAACKKPNVNTPRLEFRIFDVVESGGYKQRFKNHVLSFTETLKHKLVQPVPYTTINSAAEINFWHDTFVEQGYEGVMLRLDGAYKEGERSSDLYKYKKFKETEYEILGVDKDKDGNGVIKCDGFSVRMKGTDEERKHQADNPNKYIGKQITVRYFTMTPYGKPQFPVGITIREDL